MRRRAGFETAVAGMDQPAFFLIGTILDVSLGLKSPFDALERTIDA